MLPGFPRAVKLHHVDVDNLSRFIDKVKRPIDTYRRLIVNLTFELGGSAHLVDSIL